MGTPPIAEPWGIARFRDCTLHRHRRELLRAQREVPLEPRAFDVLVYLIDQRHRISTKDDILRMCWDREAPSDAALARTVMKIRQAINDFDGDSPLVKTIHRHGYRFVGDIELGEQPAPREGSPQDVSGGLRQRRLALLPVVNDTDDPRLGWVEFGLMSLLTQLLQDVPGIAVIPVQNVLAALAGVTGRDAAEIKLAAIAAALGATPCVWAQLTGSHPGMLLHFNLRTADRQVLHGTVIGTDPARMAIEASAHLRQWLGSNGVGGAAEGSVDLGDEFLNQAFARAVELRKQERVIEADHLLDLVRQAGMHHPAVLHESARVWVSLGRPEAAAELRALEAVAQRLNDPFLLSASHELRGAHLERAGALAESVTATLQAVDVAEQHRLGGLSVRLMVTCAGRMAMASDRRAEALLSRAIPGAEAGGDRMLLCDTYCTAARVAGFRNDWLTALRHQAAAVAIARTMPEAARSWAYGGLSWIQTSLGQLRDAAESAGIAFFTAQISGAQPQQGLAAGQAALAYIANGRFRDTAALYRTLTSIAHDNSVAMRVAREAYCRGGFLGAAGRFDDALRILAEVSEVAAEHPRLLNRCRGERIRLLVQAHRFDELQAFCESVGGSGTTRDDVRLHPLIEWALACREHLGLRKTGEALDRLRRTIAELPASEAHARMSLDAAWMHLERGEADEAGRLVMPLHTWLEQSPPGMVVAARLRYAMGDWAGALAIHGDYLQRYPEMTTDAQRELLSIYEEAQRQGSALLIPETDEPINLQWRVAPALRNELPQALGGVAE